MNSAQGEKTSQLNMHQQIYALSFPLNYACVLQEITMRQHNIGNMVLLITPLLLRIIILALAI